MLSPHRRSLTALALLLLATGSSAQMVTGFVVDANGDPVQGVNLDAFDVLDGGEEVDIQNDGTNGDGFFLSTLPSASLYDLEFNPPPATKLLPTVVTDVAVVTLTDVGVVALEQGVTLAGRVVGPSLAPVSNVSVKVLDEDGTVESETTDPFGIFSMLVPPGVYELELDPSQAVSIETLAPSLQTIVVDADTNVGTIVMEEGFVLTARILSPSATPVAGVDLDVTDRLTGDDVHTVDDNSDGSGIISVVVPRGRYDLEFCSQVVPGFAALGLARNVGAATALGDLTLVPGVSFGGTVTDVFGAPVPGADLDLVDPGTGDEIALCSDNTNAAGVYGVTVPPGTYDAVFTAPGTSLLGPVVVPGVVVAGPVVLDAVLAPDPDNVAPVAPPTPASGPATPTAGATAVGPGTGTPPAQGTGPLGPGTTID